MALPVRRRDFLAALAAIGFVPPRAPGFTPYPARFRNQSPYESILERIAPGTDEFRFEKEAAEIEALLSALPSTRALPLAPEFRGISPLPRRYKPAASDVLEAEFEDAGDGFADGLKRWIDSLGAIRRASFFVLPENLVRYEIASAAGYRVGFWKQTWKHGRLAEFTPVAETLTTSKAPWFTDATAHCLGETESFRDQLLRGNAWWRSRLDSAAGIDVYGNNGIAVGDIDGDGWDEIYVCQPGGLPNRLYKNAGGGRFEDITARAGLGVLDDTTSALFVDFRNTGMQDLVALRASGPLLFLNRGDGTFAYHADAFRFRNAAQGSFTGMAAADYDRDGRVDLYLCCYVYFQSEDQYRYPAPYHDAQNGPPNFLFRNRLTGSGGYFEDVTEEAGLSQNNNRYSFAPAWCDFDGDGWPDLYVANDFGRNNLYRNRGGAFRDEAAAAGVEDLGPGMSAAWFDSNDDGRPDLYVSNMWTAAGQRVTADPAFAPARGFAREYRRHVKGNSLYRNRGDGTFAETGAAEGVEMGRWAWSADALDFDNDGAPEIYIACGMLTNSSDQDLSSFFWRQVVSKSPDAPQTAPGYENGWNAINQLIREDYSWCGREPNVFYARRKSAAGGPARYYDFSGVSGLDFADDSRAFAAVDWDGDGNLDLALKSRLAPQIRMLRNQCGVARRSLAIRLRGTKSNRDGIGARVEVNGRAQFLAAGSGYLSQHTKQLYFGLGDAEEAVVRVTWPSGSEQQFHGVRAGFRHHIVEGESEIQSAAFGKRAEIRIESELKPRNSPQFSETWLAEPVPLPERRRGPGFLLLTAGSAPPLPAALPVETVDLTKSGPDVAAQYAIFRRYLFDLRAGLDLPLLLLIDGGAMAHKIYFDAPAAGGWDADRLAADLRRMQAGRGRELSVPFTGVYYTEPRRNYFKLGAAFYWAGYPDQAIPYLEEVVRRAPGNWKALFALGQIHYDSERWRPALDYYERALAAHPGYAPALLGAGEAHARLDNLASAERLLREALRAAPENADAANQLGLVCARQNRREEAKSLFERAISLRRDHSGAINNLAVLYVQLGQPNDAIAAFRYGIDAAPQDETLFMNLGRLYVSLGARDKAREVLRELLARKPGDAAATRALEELDSR